MKHFSSILLAVIFAAATVANAQDLASGVSRAAKKTGHASAKVATATDHGTTKAVKGTASTTGHAFKKVGHGIKKSAQGTAHRFKESGSEPEASK